MVDVQDEEPEDEQPTGWSGAAHLSFNFVRDRSGHLETMLASDGRTRAEVLEALPYEATRAGGGGAGAPDAKRYRDARQLYESVGLLYEDEEAVVRLTDLGRAVSRWLDIIDDNNGGPLLRRVALALSACQLRAPRRRGQTPYGLDVEVFPYAFIWRAMLALDGYITSDELNRAVFKVTNEQDLWDQVERIRDERAHEDIERLGPPVIGGTRANDRVGVWMSAASFGWSLITQKDEEPRVGTYAIRPQYERLLREASMVRHRHRDFPDVPRYVRYVSSRACLPKDR